MATQTRLNGMSRPRRAALGVLLMAGLSIGVAPEVGVAQTTGSGPTAAPLAPPTVAQLSALGADPTAPAAEPSPLGDLPSDQPLISVTYSNGQVTSVTGSAVSQQVSSSLARARRQPAKAFAAANPIAVTCYVNFTRQRGSAVPRGASNVTFYGGIGCGRRMLLFGQAFLLQNATTYWGFGNHYEDFTQSESSGEAHHYVPPGLNSAQRSLYVRHLTNAYFSNPLMTGVITIKPSKGTQLNKATKCELGQPVTVGGITYQAGLHCDLYSERF